MGGEVASADLFRTDLQKLKLIVHVGTINLQAVVSAQSVGIVIHTDLSACYIQ